jgi:penicillin-binding protein 1A
VHREPRTILEVRRADGSVIDAERSSPSVRVLDREDADVVTYCLRQVVERGSGVNARFGKPLAGKTGTTNDFVDAWFVGYTPKLTTAVWMGFPGGNEKKMTNVRGVKGVAGGTFPARIFRRYMVEAAKDPAFVGDFPEVTKFGGKTLAPPKKVVFPTTTTSSTTSPEPAPTTTTGEG